MSAIFPYSESSRNTRCGKFFPNPEVCSFYHPGMDSTDSRVVLWENVSALMRKEWGRENLAQLARTAGISLGTVDRMKGQQTSVGVDILDRIASRMSVKAWHLLVPGLVPGTPPALPGWSKEALDLAKTLDSIEDPQRRAEAYALALGVMHLATNPLPTPAPPTPQQLEDAPSEGQTQDR